PLRAKSADRRSAARHRSPAPLGSRRGDSNVPAYACAGVCAVAVRGRVRLRVRGRPLRAAVDLRDHAPAARRKRVLPLQGSPHLPPRRGDRVGIRPSRHGLGRRARLGYFAMSETPNFPGRRGADATSGRAQAARFSGRTAWARNLQTPLRQFLQTETGGAAVLLIAAAAALVWVNIDASSYQSLWHTKLAIRVGNAGVTLD